VVLEGVKIIDMTHFIAGPFCGQYLADYGAEVIKIEPLTGEYSRSANPMYKDKSLYFAAFNRNKKSLALDLKKSEGKKILSELILDSDVILTNFSPDTPKRLGFDYETISKINPKIIMTHITGFGQTGEYKHKSAFDGIIQAMSGIMHLTGNPEDPPTKTGIYIADHLAGIQGVIGTLTALIQRSSTKKGQLVDVSMFDSLVSFLSYHLSDAELLGNTPTRAGNDSTNVFATTLKTKDSYIYIAPLTVKMWEDLCTIIGRKEWSSPESEFYHVDGKLRNYEYLKKEIEHWTKQRTTSEVENCLQKYNIACSRINKIEDLIHDPHLNERNMVNEIKINKKDEKIIMPGIPNKLSDNEEEEDVVFIPELGEHTERILKDMGKNKEEIDKLVKDGVIAIK